MSTPKPELLAAYWTIAGDVYPGAPTEVSPFSLEDRAKAASKAGYTGMGLVHADLMANKAKMGFGGIQRVLDDNGIKHIEVEFLNDWYLDMSDPRRKESDKMRRDLLECAAALKARNFKICGMLFDENPPNIPLMRDEFAKLCEEARPLGANVIIEMMPFTNIRTIDDSVAIIGGAKQANGGLLLDIWHVVRGNIDYSEIAKVPAEMLMAIELDDANRDVVGTLFEDTRFQRRLCGEGAWDVPGFIDAMLRAGFNAPYYGVEIINETFRKQPLEVMARTSFDTTMKTVEKRTM
jgi:sugar phosphate isomerase/epimerase